MDDFEHAAAPEADGAAPAADGQSDAPLAGLSL